MADRLVRAMLVVGNAKLVSQGITPEKGQETYKQYLDNTKASLQQNPATALHNLQKDYVTFQQNKKLYDQVVQEHRVQQAHGSATPYTDVISNSPNLAQINADARKEAHTFELQYQDAIRRIKEKRESSKR
jgi:predicted DNA-binding ArsR family transcriptional regulator